MNAKTTTTTKSKTVAKQRPPVAHRIRELILKGLDNKAIHAKMVTEYGHDEDKAHYPGWYRSKMRKDGLIGPAHKAAKKSAKKVVAKKAMKKSAKKVVAKKATKKSAKKVAPVKVVHKQRNTAAANIKATHAASIKTGGATPGVGPLSVVVLH